MRFITVYFCRSNIADDLAHYASVDLTNCVKVRIIHIGIITLDGFTGSGEKILPLLSTIWTTLSNLTSTLSLLEDIVFVYRPIGNASETAAAELENFEWTKFIGRVQSMFQNLKAVTIGIGYYAIDNEDVNIFLSALRRAPGIQGLEEKGSVLLKMISWDMWGSVSTFFMI